jgi:hypothetical protein
MDIPDYPWFIIKQFLFRKIHPTAKLIKCYSERYLRPQIFMSHYSKLRNGMYVRLEKPVLEMEKSLHALNISFFTFVKIKNVR